MVFGSILDQNDWARALREKVLEEGLITIAVETVFNTLIKQSSAEEPSVTIMVRQLPPII
jgi:hypothetical protein